MDNSTNKGDKDKEISQELDLSGLQDFNFADNWSEAPAAPAKRERDSGQRGGPRRERHPDRRPARPRKPGFEGDGGGDRDSSRKPAGPRRSERPGRREERPALDLVRESPFEIQIFPEEPVLAKLTRAMRHSLRTYELFEVARLILEKPDRFHVSLRYHGQSGEQRSLFESVPDGLPFVSEEAAVDHVFRSHLDKFFTVEEVDAEPPKGSFQFIARCTLNGEFLSPPNYHRYQSILLQYYQERFSDMPFERFRSHIETVKDEEAIAKWLESMTKQSRYTLSGEGNEGAEKTFANPEEARAYLLQNEKKKVVRSVKAVRFSGARLEAMNDIAIKPYVQAYVEQQKRFPLETANSLRGRLRRQHFFIYKKGSRGISLVCAVKRKFRQPDQVFSETIQSLIAFLEQHDQVLASHLPEEFLGIAPPPEGKEAPPRDPADEEKLKRLNLDLRWLLSEGYVTEFSDGRLSAHPVLERGRPDQKEKEKKGQGEQGPSAAAPEKTEGEHAEGEAAKPDSTDDADQRGASGSSGEPAGEKEKALPEPENASAEPAKSETAQPDAAPETVEEKPPEEVTSATSGSRQPENS